DRVPCTAVTSSSPVVICLFPATATTDIYTLSLHDALPILDVTHRHIMLKKLERSEQLHKQAQALTHIGNWSWMIETNEITWSDRSEEYTSELQSRENLVCRLLLEKKKK